MTKTTRNYFEQIKELLSDNAEIVAFADSQIAKIDARKEKAKTRVTATKKANAELIDQILEVMTSTPKTITELQNDNPDLAKYSNQKLSALLNAEVTSSGRVTRTVVKRKAYFAKN